MTKAISQQEVRRIQEAWGEGIIQIGKVYLQHGDFRAEAEKHIDRLYGYHLGKVLFKPTLAAEKQFRTTKEGALSYFAGDNGHFPEDQGFALTPWSKVRWENTGIQIHGNIAMAMGNYYFTPAGGGRELKVEFSFVYLKHSDAKLYIILHDSHLPYSPEK